MLINQTVNCLEWTAREHMKPISKTAALACAVYVEVEDVQHILYVIICMTN